MVIVGIDPGLNGGLAVLTSLGQVCLYPMPLKNSAVDAGCVARFLKQTNPMQIWMEELLVLPKNSRQAISTAGRNWGRIAGCIEALQIPLKLVAPRDWQKAMFVPKGSLPIKERVHLRAKQLFPLANFIPTGCSVFHDGIVDALMIAKFGLMQARA